MRNASRLFLLSAAAVVTWTSLGQPLVTWSGANALAAGPALEKASKVLTLNREAMELYEELEFELAKRALEEAVAVVREAHLEAHLVAAKTHGNMGVLYASGFKDQEQAIKHFQAALAVKADFALTGDVRTPEAMAAFEAARSGGAPPANAAAAETRSAEEASHTKAAGEAAVLRCPTAGEAFAGDDVTLRCVTTAGFSPATVVLHYKRPGKDEFKTLPMRAKPARNNKAMWSASIPAKDVGGKWVPFYFEAKDAGGETVALAGRYESPNILSVKDGDAGVSAAAHGDEDDAGAEEEGDDNSDNDAQGAEENPLLKHKRSGAPGHKRKGKWFIGLGIGSGGGYAAGPGVEAYRENTKSFTPGVAFAGAGHVTPELGYMVTSTIAVTLQGRLQYIPRPNNDTAGGAVAAFVRALFFSGTGPSRFYGILAAGGGEGFRLKVQAATGNDGVVQDTVRGGPFVGGAGVGYSLDMGKTWELMLESQALAGMPDFSLALDVNAGVRALF